MVIGLYSASMIAHYHTSNMAAIFVDFPLRASDALTLPSLYVSFYVLPFCDQFGSACNG